MSSHPRPATLHRLLPLALVFTMACGGASNAVTAPSPMPSPTPAPAPAPAPVAASLSGTVTAQNGTLMSGATVRFLDGPNVGRSATTDVSGNYRFDGIAEGNTNLAAIGPAHNEGRAGVGLFGASTLNFRLLTTALWGVNGEDNGTFTIPSYILRVRISGSYVRNSSNFIVYINDRLIVNELLGTAWGQLSYATTVSVTSGGSGRVDGGAKLAADRGSLHWIMTEVR